MTQDQKSWRFKKGNVKGPDGRRGVDKKIIENLINTQPESTTGELIAYTTPNRRRTSEDYLEELDLLYQALPGNPMQATQPLPVVKDAQAPVTNSDPQQIQQSVPQLTPQPASPSPQTASSPFLQQPWHTSAECDQVAETGSTTMELKISFAPPEVVPQKESYAPPANQEQQKCSFFPKGSFEPEYNVCGILVSITLSDGSKLNKKADGSWIHSGDSGSQSGEFLVSFDKKGNLLLESLKTEASGESISNDSWRTIYGARS